MGRVVELPRAIGTSRSRARALRVVDICPYATRVPGRLPDGLTGDDCPDVTAPHSVDLRVCQLRFLLREPPGSGRCEGVLRLGMVRETSRDALGLVFVSAVVIEEPEVSKFLLRLALQFGPE